MALKRTTDARPPARARGAGEEEGAGLATRPEAGAWVKRALVQILVAVANIQVRTLKTEVEKGSM